ncbi:MAG TPA: SCP2 sterol-binding domain-containing protein [Solirubrobacteraceae bacterium]|jgi:predicted lipid carrier protein YhbT
MRTWLLRLLARVVASWSDEKLERRFGSRLGQRALFAGMARSFVPGAAGEFSGELEYDLSRPATGAAPVRWTIAVQRGRATARPGAAAQPRLTVSMGLADFMRVATAKADPVVLVLSGRASVRGDFGLAARLPEMFGARAA